MRGNVEYKVLKYNIKLSHLGQPDMKVAYAT